MDPLGDSDITDYVLALADKCRGLQSIWLIGSRLQPELSATSNWNLLVFGDPRALACLRNSRELHRSNVDCLVVTNGNDFESAWGDRPKTGSLSRWEWKEKSEFEAEYLAAQTSPDANGGVATLERHRALRFWP